MAKRFFAKSVDILNKQIKICGQEHLHISKVLRLTKGDEITISTEDARQFSCVIAEIAKDFTLCDIKIQTIIEDQSLPITVFQAIMKKEHMDLIIQKCTELNIRKFVPFISNFVVVKPDDKKINRYERISIEACKQSNRAIPMEIAQVLSFDDMLKALENYSQIILAYENADLSAKSILSSLDKTKPIALIVGSEGGFSLAEVLAMQEKGVKIISLGKNILRGETATIVLVGAVMYQLDEWQK